MDKKRKPKIRRDKISCIYAIINHKTKKVYIGSTSNLKKRKEAHFYKLRKNIHPNQHLQASFNLHGYKVFKLIILEYSDISNLERLEQKWFNFYKGFTYNIRKIAKNNTGLFEKDKNPFYGKTHTEDFKIRQSLRMKLDNPQKCGKTNSFYGKRHSKEYINVLKTRVGRKNPRFGTWKRYCKHGHLRTKETVYKHNYGCKLCSKLRNQTNRK